MEQGIRHGFVKTLEFWAGGEGVNPPNSPLGTPLVFTRVGWRTDKRAISWIQLLYKWFVCCTADRAGHAASGDVGWGIAIPNRVIGIFHWHNPSGRTMALGSTQLLTEKSTRNISFSWYDCLSQFRFAWQYLSAVTWSFDVIHWELLTMSWSKPRC
jgi:hypothetical protein